MSSCFGGTEKEGRPFQRPDTLVLLLLFLVFAAVLVRTAWVSDDAYITFRTVDNFIHGYGLTWNTDERVQAYTNPLWMFLVSGLYFCTRELFFSVIILSILISLAAAAGLAWGISVSPRAALLGLVLLISSKAFVDYSTSGLENPLTHLLAAGFLIVYLRREFTAKTIFYLSLLAGLAAFNRMDTVLFYLPALAYSLLKLKGRKALWAILGGFVPFLLWELFSLLYYGFPFPNSAYAKLAAGLGSRQLVRQGLFYLLNSLRADPLTLLAVASGLLVAFVLKDRRFLALAAGILLYLTYVVRIGGDFMSGRFLAAPFFFAVALVTQIRLRSKTVSIAVLLATAVFGVTRPYAPFKRGADYSQTSFDEHGIADERGFYYQYAGLLKSGPGIKLPLLHREAGHEARLKGGVIINHAIGYFGFFAGPGVHIVDPHGLSDPLLARLPTFYSENWRIGHFARVIPAGYVETLRDRKWLFQDKNLAQYYSHLTRIIRGPLWSIPRFREIIKMNTGRYNSLVDRELYRYPSGKRGS